MKNEALDYIELGSEELLVKDYFLNNCKRSVVEVHFPKKKISQYSHVNKVTSLILYILQLL